MVIYNYNNGKFINNSTQLDLLRQHWKPPTVCEIWSKLTTKTQKICYLLFCFKNNFYGQVILDKIFKNGSNVCGRQKTYLSDILCLNRPYHLQIILYSFKRLSSATLLGPFLTTLSCTKVNKNKFKVLTVYRHE